jgi:hypothetical protein
MTAGKTSRPAEEQAVGELLNTAIDTPSALVVEGEAGIGKTTVWLEGLKRARQRAPGCRGRDRG